MIKKISLDCCICHSIQFLWNLYNDVLKKLKDSFVLLFASGKISHGCSTWKTCRCPKSFFPFCTHSPLAVSKLYCWRIGSRERKWQTGHAEKEVVENKRKWRTRGSAKWVMSTISNCKREEAAHELSQTRGSGEQGSSKWVHHLIASSKPEEGANESWWQRKWQLSCITW